MKGIRDNKRKQLSRKDFRNVRCIVAQYSITKEEISLFIEKYPGNNRYDAISVIALKKLSTHIENQIRLVRAMDGYVDPIVARCLSEFFNQIVLDDRPAYAAAMADNT